MIGKSLHQQASCLRIFVICLTALLLSVASSAQVTPMVAARFLEQSSWGPTATTIGQVQQAGSLQAYLQQQFNAPISTYATPADTDKITFVQNQFFVNAINGQDQLRQRVSFALSEIIVISGVGKNIKHPSAFSLWMNMLQNDAFGNFFNIINDVTLSPSMGSYLNMAENNGCSKNCRPNENYGRELLQLFTIGLYQLNQDGTPALQRQPRPDLLARHNRRLWQAVYRLGVSSEARGSRAFFTQPYYSGPMLPFQKRYSVASKTFVEQLHDTGQWQHSNGSYLRSAERFHSSQRRPVHLQATHPETGDQQSQSAYVSRCSQTFNNDGTGVLAICRRSSPRFFSTPKPAAAMILRRCRHRTAISASHCST